MKSNWPNLIFFWSCYYYYYYDITSTLIEYIECVGNEFEWDECETERGEMGIGEAGWWHQRFTIADIDGNGRLNFTELRE